MLITIVSLAFAGIAGLSIPSMTIRVRLVLCKVTGNSRRPARPGSLRVCANPVCVVCDYALAKERCELGRRRFRTRPMSGLGKADLSSSRRPALGQGLLLRLSRPRHFLFASGS